MPSDLRGPGLASSQVSMEKGVSWASGGGQQAQRACWAWRGEEGVGEGVPKAGSRCFDNIIALLLRAQ